MTELLLPQLARQEADGAIIFNGATIPAVQASTDAFMIFYLTHEDEQNGYGTVIQLDEHKQAAIFPDLNPEYIYLFFKNDQGQLQTLLWCIELATRNPDGLYVAQAKIYGRGVTAADMERFNQMMTGPKAPHNLNESYSTAESSQSQPTSPAPTPSFTEPTAAPPQPPRPAQPSPAPQVPAAEPTQSPSLSLPPLPGLPPTPTQPVAPTLAVPPLPIQPAPAPQPMPAVELPSLPDLPPLPTKPATPTTAPPQPAPALNLPPLPSQAAPPVAAPEWQAPQPDLIPPAYTPPSAPPVPQPTPKLSVPKQPEPSTIPPAQSAPIDSQPAVTPESNRNPVGRPPKPLLQDPAWTVDQNDFSWAKQISRDDLSPQNVELLRQKITLQIQRNRPELLQDPNFTTRLEPALQSVLHSYNLVPAARQDLLKALLNGRVVENLIKD